MYVKIRFIHLKFSYFNSLLDILQAQRLRRFRRYCIYGCMGVLAAPLGHPPPSSHVSTVTIKRQKYLEINETKR